jgi:hypothetical protein
MIQDKLSGVCVGRPLASTGSDACRVIETLVDDRECEDLADVPGPERTRGWRLDLGLVDLVENGEMRTRRRCEILPADYDGNSCPDGSPVCPPEGEEYPDGLQGWFYDNTNPECEFGQVRFTRTDVTSDLSDVRFECLTALCPERRQCFAAAPESANCNGDNDCGGGVCVRHNSGEICGYMTVVNPETGAEEQRPRTCQRCSATVGSVCSAIPDVVQNEPLVGAGGCCAEGFHCDGGQCVPDRTFRCN